MSQDFDNHLTKNENDIPATDKVQWKADAQLCGLLWQSVNSEILHPPHAYKTCIEFWTQAYTHLYKTPNTSEEFTSQRVTLLDKDYEAYL